MHKKVFITGMHCKSCEKLLHDEIGELPGVKQIEISVKTNAAEIDYEEGRVGFADFKKTAQKFGYDAFEQEPDSRNGSARASWQDWAQAVGLVLVLGLAYRVLQNLGVFGQFDLQSKRIDTGIAFMIGLVASISSCLAVVGAVVLAFAEKYENGGKDFWRGAVRPNVLFHVGRLGTFFVLGGFLGVIGGEINLSGQFVSVFTFIVAAVMAWLGLNILGIVPSISRAGLRLPAGLTGRWQSLKASEHKAAPFLLGGLSFFLPCGFTQSMQIFALASGSFWTGGLAMLFFALGTVPTLLILGVTASWTRNKGLVIFQKVAGIIILIFAFLSFQNALALRDIDGNVVSSRPSVPAPVGKQEIPSNEALEQTVEMHVTANGFEPSLFRIKTGIPVRWVIKGDYVTGCSNRVIVPSLKISQDIKAGDNVIRFTPKEKGTVNFSCWMGMIRGKFIVE